MAAPFLTYNQTEIIFENCQFSHLSHAFILANSAAMPDTSAERFFLVLPEMIELNVGTFSNPGGGLVFPLVSVRYSKATLALGCSCNYGKHKLCDHQAQVLYNILDRPDLRIFFDDRLRHKSILTIAEQYGLENEPNPDAHFELKWANRLVNITPRIKTLQPVNKDALQQLAIALLPPAKPYSQPQSATRFKNLLVLSEHKYYKHLQVTLYQAPVTPAGKIKNPLKVLDPQELGWQTTSVDEMKFYTGVAAFANNHNKTPLAADLFALRALVKNPVGLATFYHSATISENIAATSLVPVQLGLLQNGMELNVYHKENFYEISGQLVMGDKVYLLNNLPIKYGYFILSENILHLVDSLDLLRVLVYFKKLNNIAVVHQSKFDEFRKNILSPLEDTIRIHYAWLVAATKEQLEHHGFDEPPQQIIYLSEEGDHILISPVMRYGEVEVSVLSKRQLFARDEKDNAFIVERNEVLENEFTALLLQQHADFSGQIHQQAFYLPKQQLLQDEWFLEAFDVWQSKNITVLGFNEINKNKLNTNKATVSVKINSGLDWFNTDLAVRYGGQKASLNQLHKSLKNGSKYVRLDDGTMGLLPAEWIKKMAAYFEAGNLVEEELRIPKVNFSAVQILFEKEMLSIEVQEQIENYNSKLADFEDIENVPTPIGLQTELRHYQLQGLNWLNFLDDFGFGGCLADDMGLGKTIQVIAFILLLRTKSTTKTHLIIVPTSLIFNWQKELEKFAPSLRVLIIQGANRVRNNHHFHEYDVVLTSYGMLLSNIHFIKTFRFGYIFLDESQAIKNPDSQRYKACRLLQSNNKIVITGTPIENNTFDLYGQLSFACPGLLGNQQYFKDVYAQPIDKFGDTKRAAELQQKINPFILRRTKRQVATELPEKTAMIIYCEMGIEQRKVYDAYEKEFRNYLLHQPEMDLPRNSMHVLQGLTKLRQICNAPSLLKDDAFYGDASAKIDVLIAQIKSKHQQHKILVFSQFVGMLNLIKNELSANYIPYEYLTGQTKDREAAVNNFQTNDAVRVFLISLKAGGTGLNLTEADYVYLVDPWWNPAVENQAIDRCYRIGQEKHVVAVRLICPDTIEEKILQLQAVKNELVSDLIKTDMGVLKQLGKEDLLGLLSNLATRA